jgi:sec-independent protein translocase protein TatA
MLAALLGIGIGMAEVLIILAVVLLIFGPSKLPQLGESIGKMLRGFRKEMKALDEDKEKAKPKDEAREDDHREEIEVSPKAPLRPSDKA